MRAIPVYPKLLKQEALLHGLLWFTVLLYPYVKFIEREGGYPESFFHELNALVFIMIPSYAFYSWWLPMPTARRWKMLLPLVLVFIAAILGYEYSDSLFHRGLYTPFLWKQLFSSSVKYSAFIGFFLALHLLKNSLKQKQQLALIAEEKQFAELSALKAQVTPHFLFNTLNGLYVDALKTDPALASSILSLSDNTRYFLKEGQQETVTLRQELEHIDNYLALQQKRLSKKITVNSQRAIEDMETRLPPLLLIPVIENAFKYASMLRGNGHLIDLQIMTNHEKLELVCSNPYDNAQTDHAENEWMKSGIGLKNVKQRLALHYPDKHEFKTEATDGLFNVHLTLWL